MFFMCLFKEAELNCVSTKIRFKFELIQLEIGISTSLYLPAIGTAGFDLFSVNGYNLDPWPPPKMILSTLSFKIASFLMNYINRHIFVQKLPKSDQCS